MRMVATDLEIALEKLSQESLVAIDDLGGKGDTPTAVLMQDLSRARRTSVGAGPLLRAALRPLAVRLGGLTVELLPGETQDTVFELEILARSALYSVQSYDWASAGQHAQVQHG